MKALHINLGVNSCISDYVLVDAVNETVLHAIPARVRYNS